MSDKEDKTVNPFQKMFNRMLGTFAEYQWERLLASHFLQAPDEKKARLKLVQELSVELAGIRSKEIFATAFGNSAIEAVIEGDWKTVADHIDWLSFNEEHEDLRSKYNPIWSKFRDLLQIACVEARHRQDLLNKHVLGQKEGN